MKTIYFNLDKLGLISLFRNGNGYYVLDMSWACAFMEG